MGRMAIPPMRPGTTMHTSIFLTCLAGLALGTPLTAQTQRPPFTAVLDDFEDGVIGSEWAVGLTLGALIHVEEANGVLRADGSMLTQSQNGAFVMSRKFSAMYGEFICDVPLAWEADPNDPLGGTSSVQLELFDLNGRTIVSWTLDDANALGAGELQVVGQTIAHLEPLQDIQGLGFLRLHRSTNDTMRFTWQGDGATRYGMLGHIPQEVAGLRITFRHSGFGAPPFTAVELDSVLLTNAITPRLDVTDLAAGQPATLGLYQTTPLQPCGFAYSLTGAGPTLTPNGLADLAQPITALPPVIADSTGFASVTMTLPSQASGRDVWIQGVDLTTGALSQGHKATIQ